MKRLALFAAMLLPTSCSLMFVNGPPPTERFVDPGDCTTSNGWPTFDVVLSALEGARTVYAITRTDADYKGTSLSRPADIAAGSVLLALTAISAGVGFSRVDACNDAIAAGGGSPRFHRRVIAPAGYAPPAVAGPPPSVNLSSPGAGERPATPPAPARPQADDPE
jgi:hypothetical protein